MIRVGLTGGIASGKSLIARLLRDLGAYVIDADALAREVVRPGTPAHRAIVAHFGPEYLRPDGTLDRRKLAQRVFDSPQDRSALEAIVHPRVFEREEALCEELAARDPQAVIVFEAPLLIEAGAHARMDRVIVVDTDPETQVQRLMVRDGLERAEAEKRLRAQMPASEKRRFADYVIDGTVPREAVMRRTAEIYRELKRLAVEKAGRP